MRPHPASNLQLSHAVNIVNITGPAPAPAAEYLISITPARYPPSQAQQSASSPSRIDPSLRRTYFRDLFRTMHPSAAILRTVRALVKACNADVDFDPAAALNQTSPLPLHFAPLTVEGPPSDKLSKIEADIRLSKLRDMTRIKQDLERRLETVNASVQLLRSETVQISPPPGEERPARNQSEERDESEAEGKRRATELVRRMRQEKLERERKRAEREQAELDRQQRENEVMRKQMQEKVVEMKNKRRQDIIGTYEELKKKREEEHKKWEATKEYTKALKKEEQYLYKRYEERYKREIVMPLLERTKSELSKKRGQLRPVTYDEIAAHRRKHDQAILERGEEKLREIRSRKLNETVLVEAQKRFRTRISSKVFELDQSAKNERYARWMARKKLHDKMGSYADIVKEVSVVHPSRAKALELQQMIDNLKHPVRNTRDTRKEYSLTKLNFRSRELGHSKSMQMKKHIKQSCSYNDISVVQRPENPHGRIKNVLSMQGLDPIPYPKKIDYLTELRKKRQAAYQSYGTLKYNWEADLQNVQLSPAEKYTRVVGKANMMEGRAKQQEKSLKASFGSVQNVRDGERVAELLLGAIKAKLAVLEQL